MGWEDRAYNRDNTGGIPPVRFAFPKISPLVWTLLGVNLGLFLLKFSDVAYGHMIFWGGLSIRPPFGDWWQLWRLVTYQYLHANAMHIFFNLLGIYFFVPTLERRWGWEKAFTFYTLGGIFAGLCFIALTLVTQTDPYLIGASGSIFAMLGAVALFYPEQQLILLFFAVPIRAAAAVFAAWFLLTTIGDHDYSNAAHLGGLAFGFLTPWLVGPLLIGQQLKLQQWQVQRARSAEVDEQQEVDRILAKVGASGMNSLTSREKKALAQASENQRKRDTARRR